jgi:hypothetical protein
MLLQARAGFGIFVSDTILKVTSDTTDPIEIVIACAAATLLLWEYVEMLSSWNNAHPTEGNDAWRIAAIIIDIAELVQSVAVFLAVRLLTDLGALSINISESTSVAAFTSFLLFVVFDSFLKSRRRVPSSIYDTPATLASCLRDVGRTRYVALSYWVPYF